MDRKKQVIAAMEGYYKRQEPIFKATRKNEKPEKDITEPAVVAWLKERKFDYSIVEAKGVFSVEAGRYVSGMVEHGFSDIVANNGFGRAMYIELKAKGRRSSLKDYQRDFLMRKINTFCFSVCTDSAEHLEKIYDAWWKINIAKGYTASRDFLISVLPKQNKVKELFGEI